MSKTILGQIGEQAAASFLECNQYKIIERNFRNVLGEIDIIAVQGGVICFIEVKTRNSDKFGSPYEAVTVSKQRKIINVAQSYLKFRNKFDAKARFDVISVMIKGDGAPEVDIIQNAFEIT